MGWLGVETQCFVSIVLLAHQSILRKTSGGLGLFIISTHQPSSGKVLDSSLHISGPGLSQNMKIVRLVYKALWVDQVCLLAPVVAYFVNKALSDYQVWLFPLLWCVLDHGIVGRSSDACLPLCGMVR